MNYLWGAVNAISAPYQYYKELPPINPATLTGAIDVIVIRRPKEGGGTELACSPFHVRFGKWQVLRPGEKKVDVTVNGKLIPFHMKVGDAGEAFFIFETEGEIPEDLITSPLLSPTTPGEPSTSTQQEHTGRFGAKDSEDAGQEPDFLDLDAASPQQPEAPEAPSESQTDAQGEENSQDEIARPSTIFKRSAGLGTAVMRAIAESEKEASQNVRDKLSGAYNLAQDLGRGQAEGGSNLDGEAIYSISDDVPDSRIVDNGDVMMDMGGYHSQQVSSSTYHDPPEEPSTVPFPQTASPSSASPSNPPLPIHSPSPSSSPNLPPIPFPNLRAPSAPPNITLAPTDEYSWEWGAFPQRSPVKAKFSHTKPKPTPLLEEYTAEDADDEGDAARSDYHRSKSLPPELGMDDGALSEPERERDQEARSDDEGPLSDGEYDRREPEGQTRERTSWVRWWRRGTKGARTQSVDVRSNAPPISRDRERTANVKVQRPTLKEHSTAPEPSDIVSNTVDVTAQPSNPRTASTLSAPPTTAVKEEPASQTSPPSLPKVDLPKDESKRFAKTLRLSSDQLEALELQPGANTITFALSTTGTVACTARIFVWDSTDHIVVSDIDGTITKSDALGHVFTMIGRDWTHLGVAKLYTDICRNGYKIMYLTSRAIGQADSTRYYLQGIKQNDYQLPEGPVIMSPDRLMASLHREVIMRKPEMFKMACLRDIQRLFGTSAPHPFYAGFGNRITDALSYRSVNIPSSRIFTIDSNGEVKMELLELAGYNSPSVASYIHMTDLVDQMFPPIQHKWETAYTDNNFWKTPMMDFPLPDLAPPSPALSARSDTSNQSTFARLRNFSLRNTGSGSVSRAGGKNYSYTNNADGPRGRTMEGKEMPQRQRQLSSIERLSSTLASFALSPSRSASPEASSTRFSGSDEEAEGGGATGFESEIEKRARRRRSMESMPGSLPGSQASSDDEEELEFGAEGGGDGEEDVYEEEEAAEQAFDEDLFATGEMQNVPFL